MSTYSDHSSFLILIGRILKAGIYLGPAVIWMYLLAYVALGSRSGVVLATRGTIVFLFNWPGILIVILSFPVFSLLGHFLIRCGRRSLSSSRLPPN